MALRQVIVSEDAAREPVRRSRGRRASDRAPGLEVFLLVGVIVAWGWGAYQLAVLFVPN